MAPEAAPTCLAELAKSRGGKGIFPGRSKRVYGLENLLQVAVDGWWRFHFTPSVHDFVLHPLTISLSPPLAQ